MARVRPLVLALLLAGCKTDKPADRAPAPPAPVHPSAAPPRPALPAVDAGGDAGAGSGSAAAAGLDVRRVGELSPTLPNARRLSALSVQASFGQARETWCTSTTDAGEAAKQVAAMLSHDGWNDVSSRAGGGRASIAAEQDGIHIAITLGGVDQACPGGLITHVVYHSMTPIAPALEPGEKVH